MARAALVKRLSLLGALTLLSSLGLVAPGCISTSAVQCGDEGFCPPGTVCTEEQDPPVCVPERGCGNGEVDDTAGEVCDDGNVQDGDGCNSTCTSDETCGNRFTDEQIDEPEECDQGEETSTCDDDCTRAACGDGHINGRAGEVCDDGNTDAGDGCDADCKSEECGNGIEEPAFDEECDDGKHCENGDECTDDSDCESGDRVCKPRNDDGCSADCQDESCGNGQRDPGEQCDDGNDNNSDDCVILSSTECRDAECGDGIIHDEESGTEECDDAGDSEECNEDCTLSVCGDGKTNRAASEDCDDGEQSPRCNEDCSFARCGDDIENSAANEACDDGGVDTAACNKDCTVADCGDGYRNAQAGEECDPGVPTSFCNEQCKLTECGDGVTDLGEDCDTDGQSGTCNFDCTTAMCGDGVVNSSFLVEPFSGADPTSTEQCDPDTGTDGGNAQRALSSSPACDRDCTFARCGDGFENGLAGEQCDDQFIASGPKPATDSCNGDCSDAACGDGKTNSAFLVDLFATSDTQTGKACDPNSGTTGNRRRASADSSSCDADCSAVRCGDGYENAAAGETCDDVYYASGSPANTATCDTDCTPAACGDGLVNNQFVIRYLFNNTTTAVGEACDPATGTTGDPQRATLNTADCDHDCSVSRCGDGYVNSSAGEACDATAYQPGTIPPANAGCDPDCTLPACGDGIRNVPAGEECDDDNSENDDDCVNVGGICKDAVCGDGHTHAEDEECDDGNQSDVDDCVDDCKLAECGDGHTHAEDEDCDDGNQNDSDACPNDCTIP